MYPARRSACGMVDLTGFEPVLPRMLSVDLVAFAEVVRPEGTPRGRPR